MTGVKLKLSENLLVSKPFAQGTLKVATVV